MTLKKWRWPLALAILCIFTGIYLVSGEGWILPRKALLATQFSASLSRFAPPLLFAVGILLLTMLAGRCYCSILCPAGTLQELFFRIGSRLGLSRVKYEKGTNTVYLPLGLVSAALFGLYKLAFIIDPLALFGHLATPHSEIYKGRGGDEVVVAWVTALFVFTILIIVPLFYGRTFCNKACIVGYILRLASSPCGHRIGIDETRCVSCGACEKACPARCASSETRRIDADRCIVCFRCADACRFDAVRYGPSIPEKPRRAFLEKGAAVACGVGFALTKNIPFGGNRQFSNMSRMTSPPGSGGAEEFRRRCVSCLACLGSCPVGILRQNFSSYPELDFDRGYCQYNCTACSESCPAGAIKPISREEKHATRIARTELHLFHCVVVEQGTECGACAEVCPTHAVSMKDMGEGKPTQPDFDADYCIGCGACYHVCPAEPRAFSVRGLGVHEKSLGVRPWSGGHGTDNKPPVEAIGGGDDEITDFPF